jgi:hypothetical protein
VPVVAVLDDHRHSRRAVETNVAYFVGQAGWSIEQAVAYHRRWALSDAGYAEQAVGFCTHPFWSAVVPSYAYGYRLVRAYAARAEDNFRRLLTEQLTTDLL